MKSTQNETPASFVFVVRYCSVIMVGIRLYSGRCLRISILRISFD